MATRRQEKFARAIKEAVSDAIANHLSDPRIKSFVSVTRVDTKADLHSADIYLSIFGEDEGVQKRTYEAIIHAKSRIQSLLSDRLQSKFCPSLRFHRDERFKETLETMKLINEATSEQEKKNSVDDSVDEK